MEENGLTRLIDAVERIADALDSINESLYRGDRDGNVETITDQVRWVAAMLERGQQ